MNVSRQGCSAYRPGGLQRRQSAFDSTSHTSKCLRACSCFIHFNFFRLRRFTPGVCSSIIQPPASSRGEGVPVRNFQLFSTTSLPSQSPSSLSSQGRRRRRRRRRKATNRPAARLGIHLPPRKTLGKTSPRMAAKRQEKLSFPFAIIRPGCQTCSHTETGSRADCLLDCKQEPLVFSFRFV